MATWGKGARASASEVKATMAEAFSEAFGGLDQEVGFAEGDFKKIMGRLIGRNDGFVNTLSELGSDRDRTSRENNQVRGEAQLDATRLEILYRDNSYAAKVVDLLPNEATRKGFAVKVDGGVEGGDAGSKFEDEFTRLGIVRHCRKADRWARLYGGGAVILGIEDGRDPSEPIDIEALVSGGNVGRSVAFAYVLDRYSLVPDTSKIQTDPRLPGFGKPAVYSVQFRNSALGNQGRREAGGAEVPTWGSRIHSSRMLRFYGVELPPGLESEQDYWGDPHISRMLESVFNLTNADRAAGNILQTFVQSVFKMKNLRKILDGTGAKKKLLDRFLAMTLSQSILSMIVIGDDEAYEKRTTNVSGFDAIHDRVSQSYASGLDVGVTRALGINPGGMGNNDEGTERSLENVVKAYQDDRYLPPLQYLVELLAATEEGPTVAPGARIEVEANPLRQLTEKQQAETDKTRAESAAIMIDRGVYTAAEVRASEPLSFVQIDEDKDASDLDADANDFDNPGGPGAVTDARTWRAPKGARDNARKVLGWIEEHGRDTVRGMTRVGLARANQLASNEPLSLDTIKRMAGFERHRANSKINPEFKGEPWRDKGYVSWLGWGGDVGIEWAAREVERERKRSEGE